MNRNYIQSQPLLHIPTTLGLLRYSSHHRLPRRQLRRLKRLPLTEESSDLEDDHACEPTSRGCSK